MNIKDVLRYGLTGARERERAAQGETASSRNPIRAISNFGSNVGHRVVDWFHGLGDGKDDRPPLLSRADRNPIRGVPDSLNPRDQTQGPPSELGQPWHGVPNYIPTGVGRVQTGPLNRSQRDALVFRGNSAVNPNRDISARTSRAEGASAFDDTLAQYKEAVKRNSWMQNQTQ
jgi:hypothetical protein